MTKIPSILVVDDEPDNFDVIEALLTDRDYVLHYAAHGQRALDGLDMFDPDVILLDVMMPGMDGIEVCEKIRANPKWKAIPIVMVTALSSKQDLANCLAAGADDFMSKPVERVELCARVQSMLRIKEQYDQVQLMNQLQGNTIHLLEKTLDELRGNLASSLSHEFNTPLNGLFGTIGILLDDYENMTPDEVKELLVMANSSAIRLDKLTQRFLNYAQLEMRLSQGGKDKIEVFDTCSFVDLMVSKAIQSRLTNTDREKDIQCNLESATVQIEPRYFQLIIEELLDNALKFSQYGTPIIITGKTYGSVFQLTIQDKGRGMTAEQIQRIGAFMQFDRTTHEQQGIGLGLNIVKKAIDLFGGKFTLSSEEYNGTTAFLEFLLVDLSLEDD